jgi:hypothetical protein
LVITDEREKESAVWSAAVMGVPRQRKLELEPVQRIKYADMYALDDANEEANKKRREQERQNALAALAALQEAKKVEAVVPASLALDLLMPTATKRGKEERRDWDEKGEGEGEGDGDDEEDKDEGEEVEGRGGSYADDSRPTTPGSGIPSQARGGPLNPKKAKVPQRLTETDYLDLHSHNPEEVERMLEDGEIEIIDEEGKPEL